MAVHLLLVFAMVSAFATECQAGALQGSKATNRFPTFVDPFPFDFWSPFAKAADHHWSTGLRARHSGTPEVWYARSHLFVQVQVNLFLCPDCRGVAHLMLQITETETSFYITVDTAGFTKDELDIHVLGNEVCQLGSFVSSVMCADQHFGKPQV